MTIPPTLRRQIGRVADMVRDAIPFMRNTLSPDEQTLAIFLRGNKELHNAIVNVIKVRIAGRASASVPSNPVDCLASMSRDRELVWLLNRLDAIVHSQADSLTQDGEPPA